MPNANLKPCVVPACPGIPVHPVPESGDNLIVAGDPAPPREGALNGRHPELPRLARPARLRQNVNPPLRYGDVVAH